MPALSKSIRLALRCAAASLALVFLISCATKGERKPHEASASAATKKKEAKPTPTPKPAPTPGPTPHVTYIASASVEGEEPVREVVSSDGGAASTPAPNASPTPEPSPTATPKPSKLNFLTQAWGRIFPTKAKPSPTPGETGGMKIRVTTPDGNVVEQVVREGNGEEPLLPAAGPTPVTIKLRPQEGIVSRMWHMVFPKKKEPPVALPPVWIGTIKLVNDRDGYALIDSQNVAAPTAGETLNAIGGDAESGVLRVTADRNPPFFIADIVSGRPRAGDRVYSPKP